MCLRGSRSIIAAWTLLVSLGPGAHMVVAQAPAPRSSLEMIFPPRSLGDYFPTQLVPGQTNVVHIATGTINQITSLQISPSTGITVTNVTGRNMGKGATWWDVTLVVAKDAAPGPRQLVAQIASGVQTDPITLTIPNHFPSISNLTVLTAQENRPVVDLEMNAANQGATFGESPYVWFDLRCGPGQPEAGIVRGKFDSNTILVSIPNPYTLAGRPGAAVAGDHCDLQVRVTDATNTESNTVKATVDFK